MPETDVRKRPMHLSLKDALANQAQRYTDDLPAAMETLPTRDMAVQQRISKSHQQWANACADH